MVLRLLVLKKGCYHKALETCQANVCINDNGRPNCDTACPSCNGEHNNTFLQVNRNNVNWALVDIFIRRGESSIAPVQLCKRLQEIKNYHAFLFNKKNKKEVMVYHIKGLILQLLATGIISLTVKKVNNDDDICTCCALGMNDDFIPSYAVPASWEGIDYM